MAIIEELLFQPDLAEKKYPAEKIEIPLKKPQAAGKWRSSISFEAERSMIESSVAQIAWTKGNRSD